MQAALKLAMEWLGEQPNTIFVGQSVCVPGTSMSSSFDNLPPEKRLEFPVAEELQLGVALGMSLEGIVPICCFPRWNFLLLAANQLVNHLDRLPLYSNYKPKVIIRVAVGRSQPLDPGPQHQDDCTVAFRLLLKTVKVVRLRDKSGVLLAYQTAYYSGGSTLIVEG